MLGRDKDLDHSLGKCIITQEKAYILNMLILCSETVGV